MFILGLGLTRVLACCIVEVGVLHLLALMTPMLYTSIHLKSL
jgi:hypothetical protein